MSTLFKLTLGATLVGSGIWIAQKLKNYASKFNAEVIAYGIPTLVQGWIVAIPVKVAFHNPTQLTINVDQAWLDVYLWKVDKYAKVGQISRALSVPPGDSVHEFVPVVDIAAIFSGNIIKTVVSAFKDKATKIRTDLTVVYSGIKLPMQTFENEIKF